MKEQNNSTEASQQEKSKKKKPRNLGPIRFEAIVPVALIIFGVGFYFKTMFDWQVKKAIEIGGYYAVGAEVNVASFQSSFWNLSFELKGLEVTDPKRPEKNLIKIGSIYSDLSWDALLRFKFVIEKTGITGIQTYVDRKKPGKVKPVAEKKPEEATVKAVVNAETPAEGSDGNIAAPQEAKGPEGFNANAIGDVANTMQGANIGGDLGNIESQLKSKAYIEQLSAELKGKEADWKKQIDSLPKGPELDALKKKISSVKINTSNIAELQKGLKEIDAIAKEANSKIGSVQQISNSLKADVEKYTKAIQEVEKLINEDKKMLQDKLKIPSFEAKDLAKHLFGPKVMQQLEQVEHYMRLARKYMPPKKESSGEKSTVTFVPPARGKGVNYQFGRPNSYPAFWLKRADITSKAADEGMNGDVEGYFADLSTDQATVGRPFIFDVKASFPEQKISGAQIKLIVDHVTSVAKESFEARVNGFPVAGQMLSNSDDVKLGFEGASASSALTIKLQDESVSMTLANALTNIQYVAQAKSQHVDDILKGIVKDIPKITLDVKAQGSWSRLGLNIESNLAYELQKGFERQLQAKINEAKQKVDEYLEKNVHSKKRELTAQFDQLKTKYLGEADKKKAEIEGVTKTAENKAKDAENSQKKEAENKAKQEVQKGVEDLKKKFKF